MCEKRRRAADYTALAFDVKGSPGMEQSVERWLVGAFAAAGIAAAIIAWTRHSTDAAAPVVVAAQAPGPAQLARPQPPAPAQLATVLPASMLGADAGLSLSVQVARLLATHDPQDAYTAYMLVSSCARFNRSHDLQVFDDKLRAARSISAAERQGLTAMCGAMTERERLARLDYLAIAVKAGVPGAAWTFAAEGPFGDPSALATRPDDPLVREWKATAATQLTQAAEAGDVTSLMLWGLQKLAGSELTDKHPAVGYGYLLATSLIAADSAGVNHPSARFYAEGSEMMNVMGGTLTPAQRAAAMIEARRIAARVKARRARTTGS
jgi:hypothetical protein